MASYYLDTSALVKLFVKEPGSRVVLDLVESAAAHQIVVLAIAYVELASAVARRQRLGDLTASAAERVGEAVRRSRARFLVQPVTDAVIDLGVDLVGRHALRAYDGLQLAGCGIVRTQLAAVELTFVSADRELNAAARREGLVALDPSSGDRQ